MITGELKYKVDRTSAAMWSGGISNPSQSDIFATHHHRSNSSLPRP
jgi:hypothetical protein